MKGIDKKTMKLLCSTYDIGAEKIESFKLMLEDENTEDIQKAVYWYIQNEAKEPRVSDLLSRIKSEKKEADNQGHKEKITKEELINEIRKARSKGMEIVVEKFAPGKSKIYWNSPYFLPDGSEEKEIEGFRFFLLNNL